MFVTRAAPSPRSIGIDPDPHRFAQLPSPLLPGVELLLLGGGGTRLYVCKCLSSAGLQTHFFAFLPLQKAALPQDVKNRSKHIHSS